MNIENSRAVQVVLGSMLPALVGMLCQNCPDPPETASRLTLAESWDDPIIESSRSLRYGQPTRWSAAGEDFVVIAEPVPACTWEVGYPGATRWADIIVRAQGVGADATGELIIDPNITFLPLGEFSVIAIEENEGTLEIRAERAGDSEVFGEVAILAITGPGSDDYEELVQEAEQILADAETQQAEED